MKQATCKDCNTLLREIWIKEYRRGNPLDQSRPLKPLKKPLFAGWHCSKCDDYIGENETHLYKFTGD